MLRIVVTTLVALLLLALVALGAAYWYSVHLPGQSFAGPVPAATEQERALAARLQRHVEAIASEPHNVVHYGALERAAAYIETELAALGYTPQAQAWDVDGKSVRNISVELAPPNANADTPTLVIGAHYDSYGNAPGANDNGTGSAAVLELARLLKDAPLGGKRLRLVLFVNEEPPYGGTPDMGSYRYAKALKENGENVIGMMSLETIGSFSDEPGSQQYPFPFNHVFDDVGNFVAFVALPGGRTFLHDVVRSFRADTALPSIGGTAPESIPGIAWSDHWSFYTFGYPAIMVTDTAPFRYRHYHTTEDTPDKVDYDKLARVTFGIAAAARDQLR
ncbi:M28 family peptidase [Hyphomicrobium sulfonivorans]|uniref:M28 family peptidase n=1 Tax=Hyphomicrobium sulfonivorans TaxID=121290 RepID=UPI00156D924C|nr:M28 family peptidase [Hyphomicrobium sulfonivorans]MBI1650020.1 M28 family peptidase [Hyphomicrobium sulfonivorans]NSL72937.1 aminopeptidase [Hyphomicrobium sulfonivorans]